VNLDGQGGCKGESLKQKDVRYINKLCSFISAKTNREVTMSIIWQDDDIFKKVPYRSESEIESAILKVQKALFGNNRFYLDIKKKIGKKGKQRNIPECNSFFLRKSIVFGLANYLLILIKGEIKHVNQNPSRIYRKSSR